MSTQLAPTASAEEALYRSRTPASHQCFVEAREYMPGADSRSTLFYAPYPAVMDRGEGCWLFDVDGNRLLDFTSNHSSLIFGYGHPQIMEAVQEQLARGTCFPGSTEPQVRLARLLCDRIASVERVRFTNSGTEATMNAIRAARAFTGRAKIAKIEGGYNGSFDEVMVSTHPSTTQVGDVSRPSATPESLGLNHKSLADVVVIPFNEPEAAARLIDAEGEQLAGVIVEPVLGSAGMIPAEPTFLETLRRITERLGILLIFDEVVSFRVAYGGAQEFYGVSPDLTCLGKLIGGGFPLGAFGGRSDIMALFDPSRGRPPIPHPGSYNANPVSIVAAAATLELLTPGTIERLNQRGEWLRSEVRRVLGDVGIPAQVTGMGSLFAMHFTADRVKSYRNAAGADADLRHRVFLGLFNEGILIDPRGVGTISAALGEAEIEQFIAGLRAVVQRIRDS